MGCGRVGTHRPEDAHEATVIHTVFEWEVERVTLALAVTSVLNRQWRDEAAVHKVRGTSIGKQVIRVAA